MKEEYMKSESTLNLDNVEEGDVFNIIRKENDSRDENMLVLVTRKGLFLNYVPLIKVYKRFNRVIDLNNEKYYPAYELEMLIEKHLFINKSNKKFCNIGKDKLDIVKKDRLEY